MPAGNVRAVTSEWWTAATAPGFSSTASMNLSSVNGLGPHNVNTGTMPSAGTSNAPGISTMASGGRFLNSLQPSAIAGAGGGEPAPSGAPASTQAAIVAISALLNLASLTSGRLNAGSAGHGGMSRLETCARMARAHGRASR